MDNLINYLLQFGQLNAQQIELIRNSIQEIELKTGNYFSEAGKTANQVAFVEKGVLRVCYYNKEGEEITRYFIDENNFAVDLNSYSLKVPSSEYIQAIIPSNLIVFNRSELENLSNTIIDWDKIIVQITNKALMEKVNRISPMLAENAKTRYIEFHKRFPNLVNRIPLNYLASYIGITKNSLSRIRREIT
ncbi:Crp/Fnr family transcriptional regulator [Winogradskyella sp.]|uniref:Crp/Fnr family transcriptional regulator n=1 Tax=Winogradskyella sp. TaxID=1883156 RepID=UPI0026344094|nr:Crp/Fnr family transcriptional regulator [Winogradskyella sp.]